MKQINKVLIVDDDSIALFLVERTIKKVLNAQQILKATNGKDALKLIEELSSTQSLPELILLDLDLPYMDGFEVLKALNKLNLANTLSRIVLLTSSNNPFDVERAKKFPITAYLQKPLTEEKLKKALSEKLSVE